ncbi:WhiB family transcriptional regulator [Streptomyces sp. NPDC087420]|uniref:WhiB family transcriptional regulator n=1 Tax=Streptomyces sp. NPDC087420 TaxID=3365785 RepID=UPI0038391B86
MALEPVTRTVLYDPERKWIIRASCRSVDSERFFAKHGPALGKPPSPEVQAHWDAAKKICSFCPVRMECRRDSIGEEYGVWGGRDERERWLVRKKMSKLARHWTTERRLAWGKELHALRSRDVSWTRVRHMTGISDILGSRLIREYLAHKRALGEERRGQVVDLPLPEAGKTLVFPSMDGRRHAWVWHNSVFADAHYKGETEDGRWIFVQVFAIKDVVQKWVRAENVRIYHPQPKQILDYVGRVDRERAQKAG